MNIQVQCSGITVLALIWYFTLRQKTLKLTSEKLFLLTMGVNSFCLVMDVVSVIAINNMEHIPGFLLALICKTYIVSLMWAGYFGLIYSRSDLKGAKTRPVMGNQVYTAILLIGTLIIYVLPIYYYLDGNVVYTYGPSCTATYFFALLYVMVTVYEVGIRGRDMNPKRRRAILMWMCIWIIAAVTQFFNASLLLVGFASVLGMIILFFELENPEANLDRETGAYNAHALGEYTKQLYERQQRFSAILVALNDRAILENDGSSKQADKLLKDIACHGDKIREVKVFKTLERELVFLTDDEKHMWEVYQDIKGYIDGYGISPYFVMLPDSLALRNVEELFVMLRHFRVGKRRNPAENSIILDEKKIDQYKEGERMETLIRSAIETERIDVFYQPIYSTKQHRFCL